MRVKQIITQGMLTEDFLYDVEGRVSEHKQTVEYRYSHPMTVNYLYDTLDRIKEVTYPAQYGLAGNPRKIVAHTYDTASRLTAMTYNGTQQAGNIVYNAADQTTQMKVGVAGTNQVTEDYTFDPQTGLLTNQKATKNSSLLIDLTYDYARNNSVGSLTGKTGHLTKITDNLNTAKNREYEFDVLGRLTKAKGGPTGNLWNQNYSYDRFGNRTNVTASGVAADNSPIPIDGIPNLSFDTTSNRINTSGYQYDVNGNQTKSLAEDGSTWVKYEYDSANRLWLVKRDSDGVLLQRFGYGATNARFQSLDALANIWTLYAATGGSVLTEYIENSPNTPTWVKSYTYFGGSQLATITPNGSNELIEFNHPDRLGTKLITNQAGGTSYEQAHLPFGRPLDAESRLQNNNKRFTSYDRSNITKLDYAINRTYDSKLGRFTQVDPIGMSASSLAAPQTLNMYSYCGNDPVNYTDPGGLFFGKLFKWIGKIFRAINKILKWVVIAVALVLLVAAIVYTAGGAMPAVLGNFMGWLIGIAGKIAGAASSFVASAAGAIGVEIGAGLGGYIAAGLYGVGAIASEYTKKPKKKPRKRPGLYQTVDQAARDWLRIMNPHSIGLNREIAVPICEKSDGRIIFGPYDIGTKDSSTVKDCPSGTKRVGSAHTHAAYDPAYGAGNEVFSPSDRINANNRSLADGGSVPNYLGTPAGGMRKFKPAAISGSTRGKVITMKPL